MTKKTSKPDQPVLVKIPIEWSFDQAPVVFANNIIVRTDEHECYLSFFEIQPPMVYGDEGERAEQLKAMKTIRANCKVQVVFSKDRLGRFVAALQEHLGNATGQEQSAQRTNENPRNCLVMPPTIYQRAILTAGTLDPVIRGSPPMYTATEKECTVFRSDSSAVAVAIINGLLHQLTRRESEDLDDLFASRKAKREGGGGLFEDLVRELGLD